MRSNYCSLESGPKLRSTLPRPKTEAAAYLNLYKLTIEKKRLEHELESIEVRRHRIQKRLTFLSSQVAELDRSATCKTPATKQAAPDTAAFNTLFLEY
jgi:hypothetical protein